MRRVFEQRGHIDTTELAGRTDMNKVFPRIDETHSIYEAARRYQKEGARPVEVETLVARGLIEAPAVEEPAVEEPIVEEPVTVETPVEVAVTSVDLGSTVVAHDPELEWLENKYGTPAVVAPEEPQEAPEAIETENVEDEPTEPEVVVEKPVAKKAPAKRAPRKTPKKVDE